MTALAHSLRRIWSATNRVPRLTGWGDSGSYAAGDAALRRRVRVRLGQLVTLGHSFVPNLVAIILTILR
jgi:hypothetical protein